MLMRSAYVKALRKHVGEINTCNQSYVQTEEKVKGFKNTSFQTKRKLETIFWAKFYFTG
jgi:hypothetical protein